MKAHPPKSATSLFLGKYEGIIRRRTRSAPDAATQTPKQGSTWLPRVLAMPWGSASRAVTVTEVPIPAALKPEALDPRDEFLPESYWATATGFGSDPEPIDFPRGHGPIPTAHGSAGPQPHLNHDAPPIPVSVGSAIATSDFEPYIEYASALDHSPLEWPAESAARESEASAAPAPARCVRVVHAATNAALDELEQAAMEDFPSELSPPAEEPAPSPVVDVAASQGTAMLELPGSPAPLETLVHPAPPETLVYPAPLETRVHPPIGLRTYYALVASGVRQITSLDHSPWLNRLRRLAGTAAAWVEVQSSHALRNSRQAARLSWHQSRRLAAAMLAIGAGARLRPFIARGAIALVCVTTAFTRFESKAPSAHDVVTTTRVATPSTVPPPVVAAPLPELSSLSRTTTPPVSKPEAHARPQIVRADAPRIPAGPRNIGSLSVESYPRGAQVFLNQVPVGVTPLTLSDVQARAYAIQIQADGYSRWSRGIYVTVNQQTRIVAILETAR